MSEPVLFPLMLIRTAGLPFAALQGELPDWREIQLAVKNRRLAIQETWNELRLVLDQERITDSSDPLQKEIMNLRRRVLKLGENSGAKSLTYSNLLQEQRPDLFQKIQAWNLALTAHSELLEQRNKAYHHAFLQVCATVQQQAKQEWLQRVLLFSSHDLLQQLPAFSDHTWTAPGKKDRQLLLSIWQYQTRAATKTSPLSRFTTLDVQRWQSEPEELFFSEMKAISTPNVAFLPLFYEVLVQFPGFYNALKIRCNPSLQVDAGQLQWLYFDGNQESFQHMPPNAVLDWLLPQLEGKDAVAFPVLLDLLQNQVEAPLADLETYLLELVDLGLLEWQWPETGLTASWCGNLYQFLGFLPTETVIVEAAHLLAWLRTAARTLGFLSVPEVKTVQEECLTQLRLFFTRYGVEMAPISAEQMFFEDVAQAVASQVPPDTIRDLAVSVQENWLSRTPHRFTGLRAQLQHVGAELLDMEQHMPFLDFSKAFLAAKQAQKISDEPFFAPIYTGKMGMLLQPYLNNGQWRAVVNGLFQGGGKMYARWLHLFPSTLREQLEDWFESSGAFPYPWHDWNNANFQPFACTRALRTPDARRSAANSLDLNQLSVRRGTDGVLYLWDLQASRQVVLSDLGLEALASKPPVYQILGYIGTAYVSIEALQPEKASWKMLQAGCFYRPRLESGPLVLFRACWRLEPDWYAFLIDLKNENFFFALHTAFEALGIPRQFFARKGKEKPQYFDQHHPLSMLQLEKWMRQHPEPIWITEMLPLPEQAGESATELVLEIG